MTQIILLKTSHGYDTTELETAEPGEVVILFIIFAMPWHSNLQSKEIIQLLYR